MDATAWFRDTTLLSLVVSLTRGMPHEKASDEEEGVYEGRTEGRTQPE